MEKFLKPILTPCLVIICLLVGCSDDDAVSNPVQEEEYLSAQIDGAEFMVNRSLGIISCQKFLNNYGGIDLTVIVESVDGELLEFFVTDYVGARNYVFGNSVYNKSWMRYGLANPLGDWFSYSESKQAQISPILEIIEDDGNFIKGKFEFEAHNHLDNSRKLVNNGNFNFRISTELD